ncbi:hypothetical protein CRE_21257 [Caenorhabditis remanei]|uniref:Uncharacterized protein n=1 Tax=Caenorhabditis remanei TaxID=31234 RepID=E3MF51_CAERE|nr:hypothetical protein CRE_21257 [Caenorhabditis remanei]
MQYSLIFSFIFMIPSVECWWNQKPIDAPLDRTTLRDYSTYRTVNFVSTSFFEEKLTGKQGVEYYSCESPAGRDDNSPNPSNGIIHERELVQAFGLVWECTRKVENGRLSLEPVSCESMERRYESYEVLSPGSSRTVNNGSVKHSCVIVDGGLRSVSEYVPGCYYNGTVYKLGEFWLEENQGDKHLVQNVTMECVRSESGYFDKKVIKNGTYYIQKEIQHSYVRLNNFYEKSDLVLVEHSDGIQRSKEINTRRFKCVETEPGHVTLKDATEEDMYCTYKNQTYHYESIWIDVTRGASLRCENGNEVMKEYCFLNGKRYNIGLEMKLSNGCVFVCNGHKNIYICEEPLKL